MSEPKQAEITIPLTLLISLEGSVQGNLQRMKNELLHSKGVLAKTAWEGAISNMERDLADVNKLIEGWIDEQLRPKT